MLLCGAALFVSALMFYNVTLLYSHHKAFSLYTLTFRSSIILSFYCVSASELM